MTPYGFCITRQGNSLLARLLSSEQLKITRVMIGGGKPAEDANLMDLENLIEPIAKATSTIPLTIGTTTSFVIEYRNDMGGDIREGPEELPGEGLSRDISINEFAVFANDPENGEIMLYYGCLGDYPDTVKAYTPGDPVISRRYPVSITVVEGVEVILGYAAGAYMTAEDIAEYCQKSLLPQFLAMLPGEVEDQLEAHNQDPNAHPSLTARTRGIELALNGSVTLTGDDDPTSETVGKKGQHYINSETGAEFECTEVSEGGYYWEPVNHKTSIRDLMQTTRSMENTLEDVNDRLGMLELMYRTQVNGNPFKVSFSDMSGLVVTGVWNEALKRVEF